MKYPSDHISDAAMARFLTGESSVGEQAYVEDWAEASPDGAAELTLLEKAGAYVQASQPTPDVDAALAAHRMRRISVHATAMRYTPMPAMNRFAWTRWAGMAVMAVLVLLGVQYTVTSRSRSPIDASLSAVVNTFITRPGQSITVQLPDGSSAALAPMTKLRYTSDDNGSRTIQLDGEALFTVINNTGIPFIVHTGRASVRVLGTTFAVRRYPTDTSTQVVVAQGKVAVETQVVSSGETAVVGKSGIVQIERGANISSALAWTTGSLAFRRTPLREVVSELERWYGVTFSITDRTLLDRPITAVFLLDTPTEAMEILSSLLQAPISIRGTVVRVGLRAPVK